MKIFAINGSPRKQWNTAMLLSRALEGAASQGAETELVHLYDLDFEGCISCFSCKTIGGESYGKCAVEDALTPLLAKLKDADAVIFGSPVYLGTETAQMRAFMERFIFPYVTYSDKPSLYPRIIHVGFIYTMNVTEERITSMGYDKHFGLTGQLLKRIFGTFEILLSTDTYQFTDYSKMDAAKFDADAKAKRREEVFPKDCEMAYEMGAKFGKEPPH
jgi:multimeric flavodoxin WrbA